MSPPVCIQTYFEGDFCGCRKMFSTAVGEQDVLWFEIPMDDADAI